MRWILSLTALLCAGTVARAHAQSQVQRQLNTDCSELAQQLDLPNATVYFSQFVPGGTNLTLPENNVTCAVPFIQVPADICRVVLYVATSERSGINMETWLPSNWTGRTLTIGNGGLNGCVKYVDLAYGSSLGFAVSGANNGHNGTSGGAFYNNEEVVEDFAWRSIYTSTAIGKSITTSFYASNYTKSYYLGCSTGGRQGFKAVQDFPEIFDGVVAGAPAFSWTDLIVGTGYLYNLVGTTNSSTFISNAQWNAIHADVLEQCDSIDGAVDGIIETPQHCNYDPSGLACSANNTATCLDTIQLQTVRSIYSPLYHINNTLVYTNATNPANATLIFPRQPPGFESVVSERQRSLGGTPNAYTVDWFRYAIYEDPSWDPNTLSASDWQTSTAANPFNISTFNGDISRFRDLGGKVLHWHGGADATISLENSPRYYQRVLDALAPNTNTSVSPSTSLDSFYRFFPISGTQHCGTGAGPWMIGQSTAGSYTTDPSGNILMALVQWVEQDIAPETITGRKYVNDTQALGVQLERRHCKWPLVAKYTGDVGAEGQAEGWECVLPEE